MVRRVELPIRQGINYGSVENLEPEMRNENEMKCGTKEKTGRNGKDCIYI